jgi:hypothetical protein
MRDNRGEKSRPLNRAKDFAAFRERQYPKGKDSIGRFWLVKFLIEELRAVNRAPLSYGQRIALAGSILPSYFLRFYPYVPGIIRRRLRGLVDYCFHTPRKQAGGARV